MRRPTLLIAGLLLIGAAIIGPAVQGSQSQSLLPWSQHMNGFGQTDGYHHMNGLDQTDGFNHMNGFDQTDGYNHMNGFGHMGSDADSGVTSSELEGAREVVVTATEFGFSPTEITATAGESINLVFVNDGRVSHDFSIPDLNVRVVAGPGQQTTAGIVLDAAGSYQIFCSFPGHADAGMIGTLIVEG